MKKIFTLASACAFALGMNAQQISISKIDHSLANDYAAGCEIDLDNDGIKELIIGGSPNWDGIGQMIEDEDGNEVFMDSRASWILKFNGTDYEKTQLSTNGVVGIRSHIIPADFNGDGNVDVYIASGGDANTLNGIFLNDGNGNLTKDETFKVLNEDGEEILWLPRAVDLADFNNDGLLDIVSTGWWLNTDAENTMCAVLVNNGDGTYTTAARDLFVDDNGEPYAMALCTIKAYDLNNDGWADILLQGNLDGHGDCVSTANGNMVNRTFNVWINLAEDTDLDEAPVGFYSLGIEMGPAHQYGNGNFNVADFNNDGTPDLFVTGESPNDAVSGWDYYGQLLLAKIIRGDLSYTDDMSFVARGKDIRPLNSTNVGTRSIDYNGDGFYDLFYLGWCTQMLDGGGATQAGWFLPGNQNGLTTYQRIPGASEQGIFFLDYGVEGDLNYTFTGYHGDGLYFGDEGDGGRSMVFTKNPWTVAAAPEAPATAEAVVADGVVTLSWTPAASEKKNVTYEYYLKKDGKIVNGCTSFIGGQKDGVRKVLREGNAYMNTSLKLTLAEGNYEWGVQTVNAALKGSRFVGGSFSVVGAGIQSVETAAQGSARYNVAGQRVDNTFKGIVIENGKKVVK